MDVVPRSGEVLEQSLKLGAPSLFMVLGVRWFVGWSDDMKTVTSRCVVSLDPIVQRNA